MVLVFAAVFASAASFALFLPDLYRASAIVLVERPVPESYVRSAVSGELEGRLHVIKQEILSRTRLTELVERFNLYPELRAKQPLDSVLDQMRRDIDIELTGPEQVAGRKTTVSFKLSYTGARDSTVADVANIATPLFSDNKVFYTSAYDTGAALLGLTAQNGEVKANEIYFTRNMKNHHGGVVLVNGYVYGFTDSILTCLEFATGKQVWRDRSVGKGTVTYADGNLYVQGENNTVGLAEATPNRTRWRPMPILAELAIRAPDLVDELVASGRLRQRKTADQSLEELRHGLKDEDQFLWLRRYHQSELMRIGLRDERVVCWGATSGEELGDYDRVCDQLEQAERRAKEATDAPLIWHSAFPLLTTHATSCVTLSSGLAAFLIAAFGDLRMTCVTLLPLKRRTMNVPSR